MKKQSKTYFATTPDGKDLGFANSSREYSFATWIQFPSEDHQQIISFSKSDKPILQGGSQWSQYPHGVVPCEEFKGEK
jgi:hypothetical protein